MRTTEEALLGNVAAHAGMRELDDARHATDAVMAAFGAHLPIAMRDLVAAELPDRQAAVLQGGASLGVGQPIEQVVASTLGVRTAVALEVVASVCHVLAERLSDPAIDALRAHLPRPVADLLAAPAEAVHPDGLHGRTLADGRAGSRHPVSEAQPERAHSGSVAGEPNPHRETKLSSSPGTTQEREHETMAEGHPGPSRPLAGPRKTEPG
jgi:uncharacterized protein (DUF2267 family)